MATKSLQARLIDLTPEVRAALERTHRIFNISMRQMAERYIAMRKGRCGEECRQLANTILSRSNTFAHGVMDKLSRPQWRESSVTDEWVKVAKRYHADHGPLLEQHKEFAMVDGRKLRTGPPSGSGIRKSESRDSLIVPAKFWHQVCDDTSAFLKAHAALMKNWRKEREEWLKERKAWTDLHPEFMAFYTGPYAKFRETIEAVRVEAQELAGQAPTAKRRERRDAGRRNDRWRLWYEWLVAHPEIIAWRGRATAAEFKPIPADQEQTIRRKWPRQDKHVPKFMDWLRENNPELAELERQRRFYEDRYRRFKRPPTLTLPSPDKHPRWFSMERAQFYKNADFEKGSLKLLLVDEDAEGIWFFRWFDARMLCDPRLTPSHRAQLFEREGRCPPYIPGKPGKQLNRPALIPAERKAGVAGAKLILKEGRARLSFTVIDQDCPASVRWVKNKERTCSADNLAGPDGVAIPLRVLAVDLGIRHLGGFSVAEGRKNGTAWQVRHLAKGIITGAELPALFDLRGHQRQLRAGRRRRGKPVNGERSFIELQDHRTHMAEDRFKKAANAIVELAREKGAHIVLFEKLSSLAPTARNERWANSELLYMNRGRIVKKVEEALAEFGVLCDAKTNPFLTSRLCSHCFKPGWRFSIKAKECFRPRMPRCDCKDYGYPVWDIGGHLFRCPHCGYSANADVNAAANIAASFFGLFPKDLKKQPNKWVFTWSEGGEEMRFAAEETFKSWADEGRRRKEGRTAPF